MTGFEPAASASRTQRSTKLSHIPKCALADSERYDTTYADTGKRKLANYSQSKEGAHSGGAPPRISLKAYLPGGLGAVDWAVNVSLVHIDPAASISLALKD